MIKNKNSLFNNWDKLKIIIKSEIKEFDFLIENNLIEEICDEYFYNIKPQMYVEELYYKLKAEEMAKEMKIEDIKAESKKFIKLLNKYNKIKDIGQDLLGLVAEIRGIRTKDVYKELDISICDD